MSNAPPQYNKLKSSFTMNKIRLITLGVCLHLSIFAQNAPKKLNVVFLLADDLGWADMGYNGSTFYETPNLDALAKESVRFNRAYAACPVCSPSRAAIMTGKNPVETGITDFIMGNPAPWKANTRLMPAPNKTELALEETTLAETMKAAGYTTYFAGKWHLGDEGFYPENQGFDINIGGSKKGQPLSWFSPYKNPNLKDGETGEYLPERLSEETCHFIETHKNTPFFAYHSFYLVHTPLKAKKDLIAKYQRKRDSLGLKDDMLPMGYDVYDVKKERTVRSTQSHVTYAAMMEALDAAVGKIVQKLKTEGLYDNTLIIFTSDNGGLSTSEGQPTSNFPIRGGKGWMYEGGIRVPLLMRLPHNAQNGSQTDDVAWGGDFYATIAEATGVSVSKNQKLDGQSLMPVLQGKNQKTRTLYWHYPHYGNQGGGPASCVMQGDYKLIHWYDDDRWELYNLKADREEKSNLLQKEATLALKMRKDLEKWLKKRAVKFPTKNAHYKA